MQESYRDIKYIYKDILDSLKSPEKTGGVLILLLLYKNISAESFLRIMKMIIDKFEFVIDILEAFLIITMISWIISIILVLIYGLAYILYNQVYLGKFVKTMSDKQHSLAYDIHNYFAGSQRFLVKCGMWVLIFGGYLYLLDYNKAIKYIEMLNIFNSVNSTFYNVFVMANILLLSISSICLIHDILFAFFYLKHANVKKLSL